MAPAIFFATLGFNRKQIGDLKTALSFSYLGSHCSTFCFLSKSVSNMEDQERLDALLQGLFSDSDADEIIEAGPPSAPAPQQAKEEEKDTSLFRLFSHTGIQTISTDAVAAEDYSALAQRPKRLESAFDEYIRSLTCVCTDR